jgi:hypothetical protein
LMFGSTRSKSPGPGQRSSSSSEPGSTRHRSPADARGGSVGRSLAGLTRPKITSTRSPGRAQNRSDRFSSGDGDGNFAGEDEIRGVGAGEEVLGSLMMDAVTQAVKAQASGSDQSSQVAALERRALALEKTVEKQVHGQIGEERYPLSVKLRYGIGHFLSLWALVG